MAENKRRPAAASSRSRSSSGRSGSGSVPASKRSSGRSDSRSGSRGGTSRSKSQQTSGRRSSTHSTARQTSGRASQPRRSESYKDSGFSGFYKAMTVLAVAGLFAALYFGGYFDKLSISDSFDGLFEDFGLSGSEYSGSPADGASDSEQDESSDTTARITTTAAPAATETKVTTTTAPPREPGNNAEYVEDPDYESPYYIIVYTGSQSVLVLGKDSKGYYNVKTKCFTCSTGASGTPTRTGLYSILRTYRWRELLGDVYGQYCSSFSGSYLFHSILYEDKDSSTLFPNSYNNLGYAASHGCVRLCVRDAKWIFDNCPKGTQVHVVNAEGPEGESYLPELIDSSKYYGWDPTDPDEDNPYNK